MCPSGMTRDSRMVWDDCLRTIKKSVSPQSFKTWFEPIKPVQLDTEVLTIQVPNKFFFEWLEEHYVQLLKKSIRQELGERGRLVYHIPESGSQSNGHSSNSGKLDTRPSADKDSEPVPGSFDAEMIKNPFIIPGIKRIKVDPQLNPNYTFENFIEGDCNRLARNAGLAIAKKPGGTAFNPLFIFGDVGLGKTHLAQAIGNDVVSKIESKAVLYVSAEKFTNQIIQAIKNNSVNDFVNFYQMIDVLIIDDIQFLSGKQKTQEIFFHIFNQLHQNGKQIILTSDRPPKDLEGMEERLISRFKWGLSADLQAPDLETRMAILETKNGRRRRGHSQRRAGVHLLQHQEQHPRTGRRDGIAFGAKHAHPPRRGHGFGQRGDPQFCDHHQQGNHRRIHPATRGRAFQRARGKTPPRNPQAQHRDRAPTFHVPRQEIDEQIIEIHR